LEDARCAAKVGFATRGVARGVAGIGAVAAVVAAVLSQ
jgi:hypothetical protein